MKKIVKRLLICGLIITGLSTTSNAGQAPISEYLKSYQFSTTGYTKYLYKLKTGSNAVCNNDWMAGYKASHTAQLINSEGKYRSSKATIGKDNRKELSVSSYDGQKALQGYQYRQRHVASKTGMSAGGTFSVDNSKDF